MFHGWGFGDTTMSIAPHPTRPGLMALIITVRDDHEVVAVFTNESAARETSVFLDESMKVQAEVNRKLVDRFLRV